MDESWRMRMGAAAVRPKPKQSLPPRRSTEETSARRPTVYGSGDTESLANEDFSDVFGGPPRTVLSRQFSNGDGFTRSSNPFYEEIFRHPETAAPTSTGRNLPEFRIPASRERSEGFYSDIFGKGEDVRRSRSRSQSKSKSKSKSNSSSVLSSEELSPLRSAGDDGSFSSFASKLRPINVPCRWNSTTMMPDNEHLKPLGMPAFPSHHYSHFDNRSPENDYIDNFRSSHFGFTQRVPSPETISLDPNSYGSMKMPMDDYELNTPSSVVSSLCQDPEEAKASKIPDEGFQEEETEQEDDEVMSSYVIEINADYREAAEEALGVDEAIAWAKEKFYTHSNDNKNWSKHEMDQSAGAEGFSDGHIEGNRPMRSPMEEEQNKWATEGKDMVNDMEMELLEEEVKSWSAGEEANIRLLLSSLHHILWPDSGWYAIPLTNLIENSQVKKAYQKARLCLHPDKLQQRGATTNQKNVAKKAFSILQEAWAAYVSQDVFFS